jgi:ethanolamine utilization protein EutA
VADAAVTFSGGVGELVYAHMQGSPWPPTTCFGDLGIDLARRIAGSPFWARQLHSYRPASAGRATVYGLLRHNTKVSGSTLFLARPEVLPLAEVPVLGTLSEASTNANLRDTLDFVRRCSRGGCLRVALSGPDSAAVRTLGPRLARVLRESSFPPEHPLVLVLRENLGKVLGQYVTAWGALPLTLIVIDEVACPEARYVHVGRPRGPVVPVSFFGLHEPGELP